MHSEQILANTVEQIAILGKGILAADESLSTIGKRFADISIENSEENRRDYRTLLATTKGLGDYISGVILFEETLRQKSEEGHWIESLFSNNSIIAGIKVDLGLVAISPDSEEKTTQGIYKLGERIAEYQSLGARFAKWRCVYSITNKTPTDVLLHANAEVLARYAHICQCLGVLPIVEPEVLMDGDHDIDTAARITEKVLRTVFDALAKYSIKLEYMFLKPNMVVPGKDAIKKVTPEDVATHTLRVLRRTVPAAVPSINFLSGGLSPENATAYLNAMNVKPTPWNLSFSYGRALQETCLSTWMGKKENVEAAQNELLKRSKLNSAASLGEYSNAMEK